MGTKLFGIALLAGVCGAAMGRGLDFPGVVAMLRRHRCLDCHGRGPLQKRVPLEDFAAMKRLELVVPGNPDESSLLLVLAPDAEKPMPPPRSKFPRVPAEDVASLRAWIASGAPVGAEGGLRKTPAQEYREIAMRLRPEGKFRFPIPGAGTGAGAPKVSYRITGWTHAFGKAPHVIEMSADPLRGLEGLSPEVDRALGPARPGAVYRHFYDRIGVAEGSTITGVGTDAEPVPIDCVYVHGSDYRYSGHTYPEVPPMRLRVYLIANDPACRGPKWIALDPPYKTYRSKSWLFFEVEDTATMQPRNAHWFDSEGEDESSWRIPLRWENP